MNESISVNSSVHMSYPYQYECPYCHVLVDIRAFVPTGTTMVLRLEPCPCVEEKIKDLEDLVLIWKTRCEELLDPSDEKPQDWEDVKKELDL